MVIVEIEGFDCVDGLNARQALKALDGRTFADLDAAERELRATFPGWFFHRGGHHLALHLAAQDWRRIVFAREIPPADEGNDGADQVSAP